MAETTGRKQHGRQFPKGVSGNPKGRPKGSRHQALLALDALGESNAQDILRTVIESARGGDLRACEILLSRLWPARKGRPINLPIPDLKSTGDLLTALQKIVAAVAAGILTTEEGNSIAELLDTHRKMIETAELEQRIAALEATK